MTMSYDGTNGITFPDGSQQKTSSQAPLQTVSASVSANALTVGFGGGPLAFRSSTLTNGTPLNINVGSLSLTVPSGATLGTVSGVASTLVLVVLYNAGAPALGVINLSGGTNLDETALISSTAISAAADSASTLYSAAAISNSSYRVVGYIFISEATAGTWASAPTLVQGVSGGMESAVLLGATAAFGASISPNGFQKLPSGGLIQWVGDVSVTTTHTAKSFPLAFPTQCLSCVAVSNANTAFVAITAVSTTQYTIASSSGAPNAKIIAIGY